LGISDSPLTLLVLEASGLHWLGQRVAMLSLAAGTLSGSGLANAQKVRQVLKDFSASWSKLRCSGSYLLHDLDPALSMIMSGAFSRETEKVFSCFESMTKNICNDLATNVTPKPEELGELVRFVSEELFDTINAILRTARLVAEIGGNTMEQFALTDELTGLPNRRAVHDLLQRNEASGWPQEKATIMHVDLHKIKQVNDTLGHTAGDAVLRHVANVLESHVQPDEFLGRVGGDEFVLIAFGEYSEEWTARRAEQIAAGVSAPFVYQSKECKIGASIGIAIGTRSDGDTLSRCMSNADLALKSAKSDMDRAYCFFTPNLRTHFEEIEELQDQIRQGLELGQFEPYFQPQVEARSGKVVGMESLARWHHPARGLLTPFQFLDAAQNGGLLQDLDRHLMEQSLAAMRTWLANGIQIPQISINLTAARLLDVGLVQEMTNSVENAGLHPSNVGLEILESVMIENDSQQMIRNIQNLTDAGFKVELDDFGTGHASISNLKNFAVDRIKIDRSFVKDLHLYSELAKITSAIIGLAHSLRIDVLAEGVESPEERLVLNALGCDHIQGFGVSRPMPGPDIPAWFKDTQQLRRQLPPTGRQGRSSTASS